MNPEKIDIEDLLADESFINYCKRSSPEDIQKWESFLQDNPGYTETIQNARARFIALFNAFAFEDLAAQEQRLISLIAGTDKAPASPTQQYFIGRQKSYSRLLKFTAVAAILLAGIFIVARYTSSRTSKKEKVTSFMAAKGERKNFQLPDGSVVTLNAGSNIYIRQNYGLQFRDVYLEGEAFFDVRHDQTSAFIVHTAAMDIRAVGTAFNVKAYPGEKTTETSLVQGIVEVTLKEDQGHKVTLHPDQKVVWSAMNNVKDSVASTPVKGKDNADSNLVQNIKRTNSGDIKETAWTENKLVFDDAAFADIATMLERWYGVKIEFEEDYIRKYRFTGIFEKEQLDTVLGLLKESKRFNYEITPGNTISVKIKR